MRTREEITKDGARLESLILEVLLDIREQNGKQTDKENMPCMRCDSERELLPAVSHDKNKKKLK